MKKITKLASIFSFIYLILPSLASASWWNPFSWFDNTSSPSNVTTFSGSCSISGMSTLKDIIIKFVIGCVLTRTVFLIIAISVIVFLWGIFRFIKSEGEDRQGGKELMFWGIVGLFVIVSVWGLVAILQSTFQLSGNYNITPNQVNIPSLNLR